MLSKHKYLFTWTSLYLAFFLCVSICNADQNNNDNLTTPVTLHD